MNFVPFCGYSVLVVRLNLALVKSLYAKTPNGLHSLDFSFWYYKRPLWDIGVILLSLGGAALSGIGLVMGFRRILRAVTRSVRSPSPAGAFFKTGRLHNSEDTANEPGPATPN